MGDRATHPSRVSQLATDAGRSRLLTNVLTWGGALLLLLAAARTVPYVRSRLVTLPALVRANAESGNTAHAPPASAATSPDTGGAPAAARTAGPALLASSDTSPGLAGPAQASFPLVPTPEAPPTRLVIPSISVDAPVVPIAQYRVGVAGTLLAVSRVPATHAVGWHEGSASLEAPGNTVINGHNADYGEVFRDLYTLEAGDAIVVYSGDIPHLYTVSEVLVLREADQSLDTRRRNARYIEPTEDDRLTLVTCHPYGSLRFRLIVIARPGITVSDRTSRRMVGEH